MVQRKSSINKNNELIKYFFNFIINKNVAEGEYKITLLLYLQDCRYLF